MGYKINEDKEWKGKEEGKGTGEETKKRKKI